MATYTAESLGLTAPNGGFQQGGWYSGRQYWGGTFSDPGVIHESSDQVGAGQEVSEEVNRASSIAAGQAPDAFSKFIAQERNNQNNNQPKSAEEVTPYLNQFQDSIYASQIAVDTRIPTPADLKNELQPETGLPDPIKRAERFDELRTEYGVADLEKQVTELKAVQDELYAGFREQRFTEEGKPVATNVISGRISEEERQYRERVDYVGRQLARVNDELNTKYNVISTYMNFEGLDYQDAVQRYENDFNRNLQMYELVTDLRKEARSNFESDRAAASANLATYQNAITSGNLSYGQLDESQKVMINKLEAQAGLPTGFTANLKLSPSDRLLSINDKTGEALVVGDNGQMQVIQTGFVGSTSSGGGGTAGERKEQQQKDDFSEMNDILSRLGGDDNVVSGKDWAEARSEWAQQGYDVKQFDNAFQRYTNPDWDTYVGVNDYDY